VDGRGPLQELAKVVVEVDRLVGLVHGEEVAGGDLELQSSLVASEDHVGDIFAMAAWRTLRTV
jgi:hypothetical protein